MKAYADEAGVTGDDLTDDDIKLLKAFPDAKHMGY
jgi:hypothetical protein